MFFFWGGRIINFMTHHNSCSRVVYSCIFQSCVFCWMTIWVRVYVDRHFTTVDGTIPAPQPFEGLSQLLLRLLQLTVLLQELFVHLNDLLFPSAWSSRPSPGACCSSQWSSLPSAWWSCPSPRACCSTKVRTSCVSLSESCKICQCDQVPRTTHRESHIFKKTFIYSWYLNNHS